MKTKLAFLIIILISIILPEIGKAQTALEIVWQKDSSPNVIDFAKISPDGKFIYGGGGGFVYKFSTENGDVIRAFDNTIAGPIYNLIMSASGNYISTRDGMGHDFIWDVKAEKCLKEIKLPNQNENQYLGTCIFLENDSIIIVTEVTAISSSERFTVVKKYNWISNIVLDSSIAINTTLGGVGGIEISHNFKSLALGMSYQKNGNRYTKTMIWDATNFKEKAVLEDEIPDNYNYYDRLIFSPDDSKLMVMKHGASDDLSIFDLHSYKQLYFTNAYSGNYLPDNLNFLVFFGDFLGNYRLELRDIENLKQEIKIKAVIIENVTRDSKHYVFCTSGSDFTFFKPSSTAVHEDKIEYEIKIDGKYITIFFKSNVEISSIAISDLNGKVQYSQKYDNNSDEVISIPNSFQTGTYICSVTDNTGKIYSEKFQVVR